MSSGIFDRFGGRKNFNTYLALILVTLFATGLLVVMAASGEAGEIPVVGFFGAYAGAVSAVLGVGNFSIAHEDRGRGGN